MIDISSITYSTPFLDFPEHSSLLNELIDRLGAIKDPIELDKSALECLKIFNLLTLPPLRQKQVRKVQAYNDVFKCSLHRFDPTLRPGQQAYYHLLRGRVLNLFEYNISTEVNLRAAITLDPELSAAWNEYELVILKKHAKSPAKSPELLFNSIIAAQTPILAGPQTAKAAEDYDSQVAFSSCSGAAPQAEMLFNCTTAAQRPQTPDPQTSKAAEIHSSKVAICCGAAHQVKKNMPKKRRRKR